MMDTCNRPNMSHCCRPHLALVVNSRPSRKQLSSHDLLQYHGMLHVHAYMQSFESELRDSTEYYMWQTEMRDRDAAIRKEQVHYRVEQSTGKRGKDPNTTFFCLCLPIRV